MGSTLGPLRTGRSYSSESTGTDCGCPWVTAVDRCLGHVEGTAGDDELWLRAGSDGHQLDRSVRPVLSDYLPRWQVPAGHCSTGKCGADDDGGLAQRAEDEGVTVGTIVPFLSWGRSRHSFPVVSQAQSWKDRAFEQVHTFSHSRTYFPASSHPASTPRGRGMKRTSTRWVGRVAMTCQ